MARKIEVELSVNGINEGFFIRSADGTGRFYPDWQFRNYLREHMESRNQLLLMPGEAHKYNRPRDAGRS